MSKKAREICFDIMLCALLFYAWGWMGVWFNQASMREPSELLPITEFTEGHLAGTVVGVVEWEMGSLWDLYVDDIGWPDGLVYRPMMWPSIALGALVGPVLAINLLWSYALSWNAACGFFAIRVLGLSRISAIVAGSLMAWNPWVRTTLSNGQFEQSFIGTIALLWGFVFLSERHRWAGMLGTFLVVVLGGLAVPNVILTGLVALPVLGAYRVLSNIRRLIPWSLCAAATIAGGLLVNSYQSAGFSSDEPQFFSPRRADDSSMDNVATLSSLLEAPSKTVANNQVAHIPYQGEIWPKAGLIGAVVGGGVGRMGILAAVDMVHFSLGPSVQIENDTYYLPVSWLAHYAPILAQSGSYYRFAMGGFVGFALCVAAGLHQIRRYSLIISILIGGFIVQEGIQETEEMRGHPIPLSASSAFDHLEVETLLGGKGAVLGLPLLKNMNCDKGSFGYVKEYWLHRRPILHTMEPPIRYRSNEPKISRLMRVLDDSACSSNIKAAIQRMGVGAVILYTSSQCNLSQEQKICLEQGLGIPQKSRGVWLWDGVLE
ncbi:MAG: hypothetical protein CL916_05520 [Deltaproteobacteria bacterium]|nr:hypothetical protein [Deltaproteobacteria bacterium]